MKKAIFLGSNGYLARNLISFLLGKGFELQLFDLQDQSKDGYSFYEKLNINHKRKVSEINFNVDYVFLFSALTGTKIGFEKYEEFIKTNEIGVLNVIDEIKKSKSKARLIFPSTRLVYKGIKDTPLKEDSEQEIKTIYAANKIFNENILQLYSKLYNLNYTVFRICVPYNNLIASDYSYGTIGSFITKASKGEDITLFGDGSLKRTFTNIKDIVNIIYNSIITSETNNKIYNIGGETYSLKDVAEKIALLYNVNVVYVEWPKLDLLIESGDTIFDSRELDKILEHKKYHSLQEWLSNNLSIE